MKSALFYRGMEREFSLSAIDSSRSGFSCSGSLGGGEFPMLFYLAMVDKHDSTWESRGYWDWSDSTECDPNQSFSPRSTIGTDHSWICSGAERE